MNNFDFWAVLISAAALLFSVFSLFVTSSISKNASEKQLVGKLFEELFFDTIQEQLPRSLMALQFQNGTLSSNYQDVCNHIYSLIEKARFYIFFDEKFYKELLKELKSLDELIIQASARTSAPVELVEGDISNIHKQARTVYVCLRNMYSKT